MVATLECRQHDITGQRRTRQLLSGSQSRRETQFAPEIDVTSTIPVRDNPQGGSTNEMQDPLRRHRRHHRPFLRRVHPGRHRSPVVARHGRQAGREGGRDRRRLQRVPVGLQDHARLQGQLHRDHDRRHRRVPRQAAAAHRAGLRGRHGHHDGRQGRHLSGLRADEGRGRSVRSGRLPAGGHRLLHRHRRQHAVDAVQQLHPGALLQQDCVREGRHRGRSEDLAGGRGGRDEAAGRGLSLRIHHRLAVLGPDRELLGLAQPADRHQGQRLRRHGHRVRLQQPRAREAHRAARRVAEVQDLRLRRPALRQRAEVLRPGMRDVHELLGRPTRG